MRPLAALVLVACGAPELETTPAEPAGSAIEAPAPPVAPAPAAVSTVGWTAPDESTIPPGPLGDAIRDGMDLFTNTATRLPEYSPSTLSCQSCHIDKGRTPYAVPLVGAQARFPKYMERTGAVITLQDRVNYCFTRSLSGSRLPVESQEMTSLVAYIGWLSTGIPTGTHIEGEVLPPIKDAHQGDPARGEALFAEKCVACHQADGQGVPGTFPALWGPRSFSIGASMAREERAAAFIQRFMPQTARGSLTVQEAFDLSAFVNSHPRPDSPAKEDDWPKGGAPADVPYDTKGHPAYRPPPLLPRARPELSVVPKPLPAAIGGS